MLNEEEHLGSTRPIPGYETLRHRLDMTPRQEWTHCRRYCHLV